MIAERGQSVHVGCAGWAVPSQHAAVFPAEGSHLQRYAGLFSAVEINSSFYRPHRPTTYARWSASVPAGFRFAVKVPREITHTRRLVETAEFQERFLAEVEALGEKLGPLLVQLPPSLTFDADVAGKFFKGLRQRFAGALVCEPRHKSWFRPGADRLLANFQVARVAADPAVVPEAGEPAGWDGLVYYRLHGHPRMYYSSYTSDYLDALADRITRAAAGAVWCVFDNTAEGAAAANSLELLKKLGKGQGPVLLRSRSGRG